MRGWKDIEQYDVKIVTRTNLCIGGSRGKSSFADKLVFRRRTLNGERIVIPASTLKGNLRNAVAYLYGADKADGLFGSQDSSESKAIFFDFYCKPGTKISVAPGVKIDRGFGSAVDKGLYFSEVIPSATEFNGIVICTNVSDEEHDMLKAAFNWLEMNGIGSGRSRGQGKVKISYKRSKVKENWKFNSSKKVEVPAAAGGNSIFEVFFSMKAISPLLIGNLMHKTVHTSLDYVPASVIRGSFLSALLRGTYEKEEIPIDGKQGGIYTKLVPEGNGRKNIFFEDAYAIGDPCCGMPNPFPVMALVPKEKEGRPIVPLKLFLEQKFKCKEGICGGCKGWRLTEEDGSGLVCKPGDFATYFSKGQEEGKEVKNRRALICGACGRVHKYPSMRLESQVRNGIDPGLGSVAEGRLFEFEAVPVGTVFYSRLVLKDISPKECSDALTAIKNILEIEGIGGCKSIGLGKVLVEFTKIRQVTDKQLSEEFAGIPKEKTLLLHTKGAYSEQGVDMGTKEGILRQLKNVGERAFGNVKPDADIKMPERRVRKEIRRRYSLKNKKAYIIRDRVSPGSYYAYSVPNANEDFYKCLAAARYFPLGAERASGSFIAVNSPFTDKLFPKQKLEGI